MVAQWDGIFLHSEIFLTSRASVPALVINWVVVWNEVCPSVTVSVRRVPSLG